MTKSCVYFLFVCLALLHISQAQNYHFSNGWYAGRKRSAPTYPSQSPIFDSETGSSSIDASCNISPESIFLINKILQEEVARIQKVCTSGPSSGLRALLESTDSN
ncbi:gonadotropin-releasing hormone/corazonin protein [Biomphalaria glabrata]|nr:gonadotropin-releasing hormone/corazonin protein [Biomphalaria glabrata]